MSKPAKKREGYFWVKGYHVPARDVPGHWKPLPKKYKLRAGLCKKD